VLSHILEWWGRGVALNHFGLSAFKAAIRVAPYPRHFQPRTHISKYDGETNSDHWLKDYHLTMKARGQTMTLPFNTFLCFCQV
jgi:hypothetical protein